VIAKSMFAKLTQEGIDALLESRDADIGYTPLHVAALYNNLEMLRFLMNNGANSDSLDYMGGRAVDIVLTMLYRRQDAIDIRNKQLRKKMKSNVKADTSSQTLINNSIPCLSFLLDFDRDYVGSSSPFWNAIVEIADPALLSKFAELYGPSLPTNVDQEGWQLTDVIKRTRTEKLVMQYFPETICRNELCFEKFAITGFCRARYYEPLEVSSDGLICALKDVSSLCKSHGLIIYLLILKAGSDWWHDHR